MTRYKFLLGAVIAMASSTQLLAVEVRVCGPIIQAAPLNDARDFQSALVQAFAVVNTGQTTTRLTDIAFELKQSTSPKPEAVRDVRMLGLPYIIRAASLAPQIESLAKSFPPQLCNGKLLVGAKLASSDTLAPGEALVFVSQPFAWPGARDRLEISATTLTGGVSRTDRTTLNIASAKSKTSLLYPVVGRTYVAVASSFHNLGRWIANQEFAHVIVMLADAGKTHTGDGSKLSDYPIFGQPVRAAAAGKVVTAVSSTPDNESLLKRDGESDTAFLARYNPAVTSMMKEGGPPGLLGNHVVIDHGNGEFSIYAHLQQASLKVAVGSIVQAGQTIAAVGSSGESAEPSLMFLVCDTPDTDICRPIPPNITGYRLPTRIGPPRTIQTGDIVETVN